MLQYILYMLQEQALTLVANLGNHRVGKIMNKKGGRGSYFTFTF